MKTLRQAVLVVQLQLHIGSHADHRNVSQILQHLDARVQNRLVSPEFVDDETFHHLLFFLGEKHHRPDELGKNSAPIDISHQKHRRFRHFCHTHVDQIVLLEIDLRRTSRTLDDDDIILGCQVVEGLLHLRNQLFFEGEILSRRHISQDFPIYDHLGAHVVGRFQKDRVHVDTGLDSCGLRLHDLGSSHLEPLLCDEGV